MSELPPRNITEPYTEGTYNFPENSRKYFIAECTLGSATISFGGGSGSHPMEAGDINEMPQGNTGTIELIVAAASTVVITTNSHP